MVLGVGFNECVAGTLVCCVSVGIAAIKTPNTTNRNRLIASSIPYAIPLT
jgi:hypothetical protein